MAKDQETTQAVEAAPSPVAAEAAAPAEAPSASAGSWAPELLNAELNPTKTPTLEQGEEAAATDASATQPPRRTATAIHRGLPPRLKKVAKEASKQEAK